MRPLKLLKRMFLGFVLISSALGLPQNYLAKATVKEIGEDVIVSAKSPRPLEQAILALSEHYGWTINYEDPIYSKAESIDAAAPEWRRTHPTEEGLLTPAGGTFEANIGRVERDSSNELAALQRMVNLYNESSNPGYFDVIQSYDHRIVVTGRSRFDQDSSTEMLNKRIAGNISQMTAIDAIQKLTAKCFSGSNTSMNIGTVPINILNQSLVKGRNDIVSCREQLNYVLSTIPIHLGYFMLYDIGSRTFILNITGTGRSVTGGSRHGVPPGESKPTPK